MKNIKITEPSLNNEQTLPLLEPEVKPTKVVAKPAKKSSKPKKSQSKKKSVKGTTVKRSLDISKLEGLDKEFFTQKQYSDEIWNAIKDKDLGLFGLENQTVEKYCIPFIMEPDKLHIKYKVSSVVPALEDAVKKQFSFQEAGPYLIISKKK